MLGTLAEHVDELPMTRRGLVGLQRVLVSSVARIDQLDELFIYDASGQRIGTSVSKYE